MAITHGTALRGTLAAAVLTGCDAAASFAKIRIKAGATYLCDITLPKPSFSRSGAVLTLLGVPLSGTASAAGTADNFEVTDSTNVVQFAGTVATSGGDFTIDNASIANGQTVRVTAGTYTASL